MSWDQNAVWSHNIKIDNSSFERVEELKFLGRTLINQNYVQKEVKSRWKSRNACYHSVQKLLSSSLLSKNLKNMIYTTKILPVVLNGCETWSLILWQEVRPRAFKNKVLRRIFGLGETRYQGSVISCMKRSWINCTPHPILFGW
jgi:hypothetical protein